MVNGSLSAFQEYPLSVTIKKIAKPGCENMEKSSGIG
jgi:hypothetical protein